MLSAESGQVWVNRESAVLSAATASVTSNGRGRSRCHEMLGGRERSGTGMILKNGSKGKFKVSYV